jgi:hypothetical protein
VAIRRYLYRDLNESQAGTESRETPKATDLRREALAETAFADASVAIGNFSMEPPWLRRGLKSSPGDYRGMQGVYWWSLLITALLVSLYQFFSILPAARALTRAVGAIVVVFGAGYALLYGMSLLTKFLLARMGIYKRGQDIEVVWMALGPWIALTALMAVITSTAWVPDLVGLAAVTYLSRDLSRSLSITPWQAAGLVFIAFAPLLALLLFWSWSMGWNFTPFY